MDIFAICKLQRQSEDCSCYFGMIVWEDPGKSNTECFIKWIEGTLKLTQQEEKRKPRMLDLTPTTKSANWNKVAICLTYI